MSYEKEKEDGNKKSNQSMPSGKNDTQEKNASKSSDVDAQRHPEEQIPEKEFMQKDKKQWDESSRDKRV